MPRKCDPLVKLIWGTAAGLGLNAEELSRKVGITSTTLWRRKKNPGTFTRSEIEQIGRRLGITAAEMQQATIRY